MGRRPNPLVVEFFERGAKLDDNSNRYQHTCKRCGELFPKGRSDSLTSHLLHKCPNVTQEDRQWVFQQIQQTPEKPTNKASTPVNGLSSNISQEDPQTDITLQGYQQQSALDTLAEVSRRHLDYSTQRGFVEVFQEQRANESINEQAVITQLREDTALRSPVTTGDTGNLYLYATDSEPHQVPHTSEVSYMTTGVLAASPLVQAASAANHQLELAQAQNISQPQNGSIVDPQLHDMGAPPQDQVNGTNTADHEANTMAWNLTSAMGPQQTFGNLSMPPNRPTPGFGLLQKPTKQKTRSHFNDIRRKEVQEIRKRGACIRCRMLKKPCSGETPCSTCRNVESARLWKGTCIRTRLAEEFSLWSARLFYARAKVEIPAAVYGFEQRSLPGRIEARFLAASDLCISFAVRSYGECAQDMDADLQNGSNGAARTAKNIWLLEEDGSMPDKLEAYANRIADDFIDQEPSPLMRATLQRAQTLIRAEEVEQAAKTAESHDEKSPRASYSLQDRLLKNVIELWIQTKLLPPSDKDRLQLRYDPAKVARQQPEIIDWKSRNPDLSTKDVSGPSQTYQLIKSQLVAAVEARCSKLSKIVMNELERRLLQRQQVSRFATFLSAVILLSSVERMTGLFRSFDTGEPATEEAHLEPQQNNNGTTNTTHHPSTEAAWGNMSYRITDHPNFWPLDTPPSALWPQGPHFADLLTMLLRMRALPPKTAKNPDGTLAAIQDYSLPVHISGKPVREQIDEQMSTAAAWLDPLKLKVSELVEKRDGQMPAKDDGVEEWGMRFVAKVLLPERIR